MVLFLDVADLLIAHLYLGAMSNYCLVVEGRVEIDVLVGNIDHTLEKQFDICSTCIVLQDDLILVNLLELLQDEFTPR